MHRDNYICLSCRIAFKNKNECPECGNKLICIGHRWRVPKRSKVKEWKKLEEKLREYNSYYKEEIYKHYESKIKEEI